MVGYFRKNNMAIDRPVDPRGSDIVLDVLRNRVVTPPTHGPAPGQALDGKPGSFYRTIHLYRLS